MMASSTEVSRLLQRSMTAVAKRMPLELGHLERDPARRRGEAALVVAGAVGGALVGALVGPGADELVGLLVEHRVDGLLDGFPDQLAQFVFHGLLVE